MKGSTFYKVFVEFIADIYDAENQIVKALPKMIQHASDSNLKTGLTKHLEETKEQVSRLKEIFSLLGESVTAKPCDGMKGLLKEGEEVISKSGLTPAVKDCFIIIAAQKVEHYEIASYGSALALVKHLEAACGDQADFDAIESLLKDSLDEEVKADKTLTAAAEGKMFMKGVNDEIEKEVKAKA